MEVLVVSCTFPDHETAERISRLAVENRLAACATLLSDAESIYRWKGRIETARETAVTFKTTRDRLAALQALVLEEHPYDVPEVVAWQVSDGAPAYLAWVEQSTRQK
jgi:periplasmic divalent cation tolerance protein